MRTKGPDVSRKPPADLERLLHQAGLTASCYQPVTLFVKNGRKLPNVAEPCDPWQCFLRRPGEFGVVARAVGPTLRDAVEEAFLSMLEPMGLLGSMSRLGEELGALTEAVHACQN
jgi:hypothetical protein